MKYRFSLILFILLVLINSSTAHSFFVDFVEAQASKNSVLKTIVIDPGHGGEDSGAIGPSGIKEKDITLEIAKKLEKLILQKMDVKVILTRTDDTFIPLDERTNIANKNEADLFISIHANASYRKGADGVETYFLSFEASDEDAKRTAAFENSVASMGRKTETNNTDDLKTILMDMAQTSVLNESSQLAEVIQENLCKVLKGENRGVKQAPFIVLAGAAMPAALVEIGFISNAQEEKRLASKEMQ
ncbi:MAG: N-acetylmuramoyl-L-alanine amidase, partial [Deltaproteobacteria bacterium]|nr:N-acetylmuramoyl-L-alanine amidase [Deltaproteobacteria bacterium]